MALYVTISMESAPANQVLLVTSVTNVNMDNMDFPTVTVSFCNPFMYVILSGGGEGIV